MNRIEATFRAALIFVVFWIAGPGACELLAAKAPGESAKAKLFLSGGVAIPSTPAEFANEWNTGFSGNAALGFPIGPIQYIVVGLDGGYFPLDDSAVAVGVPGVSIDGGTASIIYVSGAMRVRPLAARERPVQFFVEGGLGYFRLKVDDLKASDADTTITVPGGHEGAIGVHVGAGLNISYFLVEARYIAGRMSQDFTGYFTIRAGVAVNAPRMWRRY